LPSDLPTGAGFLAFEIDPQDHLTETDESSNLFVVAVTVGQ